LPASENSFDLSKSRRNGGSSSSNSGGCRRVVVVAVVIVVVVEANAEEVEKNENMKVIDTSNPTNGVQN